MGMSKSIRLSDELLEQAKKSAKVFHRSPPQHIEHWAQIGRVMESALSYGAQEKVKTEATWRGRSASMPTPPQTRLPVSVIG
jgi:predicted transcriptional regulator